MRKIGTKSLKVLSTAAMLACAFTSPAMANDSNIVVSKDSAYSFENANKEDKNTITLYNYNSDTNKVTENYYKVNLKKTEYGVGDNSQSVIFEGLNGGTYEVKNNTPDSSNLLDKIYNSKEDISSSPITGNFIGLTTISSDTEVRNTAIYNFEGVIGNVVADFVGNYSKASNGAINGGAICNKSGTIGSITGNFIGNHADAEKLAYGGALYNYNGNVDYLRGDFIANYAKSNLNDVRGGAIYNHTQTKDVNSVIAGITGDFIGNRVITNSNNLAWGGAIYNRGYGDNSNAKIGEINSNFIENSAVSILGYAEGGAIYTAGRAAVDGKSFIGDINGSFIGNYADGYTYAHGGAIYNGDEIKSLNGNFFANYAQSESGVVQGGAIYNSGTIDDITGDFIGNYVESKKNNSQGGAIYNNGSIGKITGSFTNNTSQSSGGAIFNSGFIGSISGNFINNSSPQGSALYLSGLTDTVEGYFEGNRGKHAIRTYVNDSVINEDRKYNIYSIKGTFIDNDGAIHNTQKLGSISGVFKNNHVQDRGGAILHLSAGAFIDSIYNSTFENNYVLGDEVLGGGAIYFGRTLYKIENCNFENNYVHAKNSSALGGAIRDNNPDLTSTEIINSNFIDNYAKSETGEAHGGAIYTTADLNIIADNGVSTFSGNYTMTDGKKDDNAIYMASGSSLNFQLKNGGSVVMKDNIRGASKEVVETDEDGNEIKTIQNYRVNIQGDDLNKTTFYLHNDIYAGDVSMGNTTLNTINNDIHTYNFNKLTLTGDTNMLLDVDLANKEMDRFTANSHGNHNGNLNVVGMNLLSDANENESVTAIYFAQPDLKYNVSNGTGELPQKDYQTTVYTPIYKYNVSYDNQNQYDNKGDGGYFLFTKGDKILTPGGDTSSTGNPSDAFNPAVLSSPVSTVAATQATINETFKYVFEHADAFTQLPSQERQAKLNSNKYALSSDFDGNRGSLCYDHNNQAGWFRPYVTFESMHLNHGPKVSAITYGSLAGFDTNFKEHKNGWHSVGTGYIGYNGSQLNYSGTDTSMNGGLLGYTETFYKGNFWSALTATAGASVGESKTMYGKENYTTLMAGLGSKTGYNFEFKEGKYILQPIMFMSYTFANTFDYTNAAGVKIKNTPAHSIQLNPSVRFIANTKKGWQPYASVGMVWNVLNENKITANNVKLPEMSMKPYVEYGIGIQRNWKDKFTAFGQAMLRNGGRNGIALTAGFRWSLGKEGAPIEKVDKNSNKTATNNRTILKQLSSDAKTALGKSQNTTRTTNTGILKQL